VAQKNRLKVAIAQTASGPDVEQNVSRARALVEQAIRAGADLIALPETVDYRGDLKDLSSVAHPLPGPALEPFIALARSNSVWILAGSIHEANPDGGGPFNTSVLISPQGETAAVYRKLHLFDITLGDRSVAESAKYTRGSEVVTADIDGWSAGLSICYDIRFPELYRALADEGVSLVFAPSSFTAPTGAAHWEILLRARAIENQCFMIAPGQAGIGAGGIATYGNSMIVAPWGQVLARAPQEGETIVSAVLDYEELEQAKQKLPVLHHRRRDIFR
jgi:predicted amidohydrolase